MSIYEYWSEVLGRVRETHPALFENNAFQSSLTRLMARFARNPNSNRVARRLMSLLFEHPALWSAVEAESRRRAISSNTLLLRDVRENLLRQRMESSSHDYTAPHSAASSTYAIVPVWYATDRDETEEYSPKYAYGTGRGDLDFGRVDVSIPHRHKIGRLESPAIFRLEFREDSSRHVILVDVVKSAEQQWLAHLRAKIQGGAENGMASDILLFIHGYNTSWEDAARRTAQFAYDLEFSGTPVLFSWPSQANSLAYTVDENEAANSVGDFVSVLESLMTQTGARRIYLVAHSMGNRVLTEGLRRLRAHRLSPRASELREVIFAAPDVDAETFQEFVTNFYGEIVADLSATQQRSPGLTLYACGKDWALGLSSVVHKFRRAGDTRDGILVHPPMSTIDATSAAETVPGHSYLYDNQNVFSDLYHLIVHGHEPQARYGLRRAGQGDYTYWIMKE